MDSATREAMPKREHLLIALASIAAMVAAEVLGGASWRLAISIGLLVLLALVGRQLWKLDPDRQKAHSTLGTGLLVSVVVAGAVGFTQLEIDRRATARLRQSDQARERSAQRQTLQLTVGLRQKLAGIDLRGRDLSGFYLEEKDFTGATFSGADLRGADFVGATLNSTYFDGADLDGADISETYTKAAKLRKASLRRTDVSEADLTGSVLSKADLFEADLSQAQLEDADFRGANLRGANLRGATFNDGTKWPSGFDPEAAGATKSR
jgi:uncharacterized protein YjbI with pentapeptide repeats